MEVVGLKNFVQDDVNKLIAKFVGVKPHPIAKLLKPIFQFYCFRLDEDEFNASIFLFYRVRCYRCNDHLDGEHYAQNITHFKLCSYCFDDEYFCEKCHEALTVEEMETNIRPILCDRCWEDKENEESEEDDEQRVDII